MDAESKTDTKQSRLGGPLPGLLRPPLVFLAALFVGILLNWARPLPFLAPSIQPLGPVIIMCSVFLFLLSYREFRTAGTPVRGSQRTTTIVRTGPYRFSRNPIYLSFILLVLGLSIWMKNLWSLITLIPAVALIAVVVIPREESFLESSFNDQYANYKSSVRRWL
jgi:protein-S-isoprenylcysteine O-methyltransferase Ste14